MKGTKRRREFQTAWCVHVSSQGRELHTLYTGEVGRVPVKASKVQRNGSRTTLHGLVRPADRPSSSSFRSRPIRVRRTLAVIRAAIKVSDNRSPERVLGHRNFPPEFILLGGTEYFSNGEIAATC